MICIKRSEKAPNSLNNQAIKDYLDDLFKYKNLSEEEKKTTKKPDCSQSCRKEDIFEAFDRDFYSKCYLTEKWFFNSWAMDVEHFKSKAINSQPELKYDWNNLFPADHDANLLKPVNEPDGGYLNPCIDDVENEIIYHIFEGGVTNFLAKDNNNIKARNTATLLKNIHNGKDCEAQKKAKTLQLLICKRHNKIKDAIIEWLGAKAKNDIKTEKQKEMELQNLLSRKNAFTMLMRSIPAVRNHIPEEFLD